VVGNRDETVGQWPDARSGPKSKKTRRAPRKRETKERGGGVGVGKSSGEKGVGEV